MKLYLLASIAFACQQSLAQQAAPQLSDLEKIEQLQRAIDATNKLEAIVEQQSRQRNTACMRSFGHLSMCKCLSENLPMTFTFVDYISITTQSKEQNGYANLDKDTQKAYNTVGVVRDRCVRDSIK